jgi:hypothetical protein
VSSDRLAGPKIDHAVRVGRALVEAAVGPVAVVMLDVLTKKFREVSAVPDEGAIAELAAYRSDPPFRVGVRDRSTRGVRMIVAPSLRKASSKPAMNWPAPSRIKNRIGRWSRIRRFRAAWVVQGPVGFVVMPPRCTRRVSSSMKNNT